MRGMREPWEEWGVEVVPREREVPILEAMREIGKETGGVVRVADLGRRLVGCVQPTLYAQLNGMLVRGLVERVWSAEERVANYRLTGLALTALDARKAAVGVWRAAAATAALRDRLEAKREVEARAQEVAL